MSDIAVFQGPPGSREVGVRIKPALRLAIGYKDPQRRGAPVKVDYFIPKLGQENEFARAAAKFTEVYKEKPKAIEIRLPGEFGDALDIRYKAFAGAGDDGGGVMVAKGDTNFALYDYVGGPDTLTIWRQDGTVEEVQTAGIDAVTGKPLDDVARDLKIELYTTFRFGIPNVLGYGSHCEITSKGKATTDTLWFKLRGLYGTFGARTAFVVRPMLVVRPASARPVVTDRDSGAQRRIKSRIYVLDIVVPETEDDMIARLRDFRELTEAAAGSLYAASPPERAALAAGAPPEREMAADVEPEAEIVAEDEVEIVGPEERPAPSSAEPDAPAEVDDGAEGDPGPDVSLPPIEEGDFAVEQEPPPAQTSAAPTLSAVPRPEPVEFTLSAEENARLPMIVKMKIPMGSYQDRPLGKILEFGSSGRDWLRWALQQRWEQDPEFRSALGIFCKKYAPEVLADVLRSASE